MSFQDFCYLCRLNKCNTCGDWNLERTRIAVSFRLYASWSNCLLASASYIMYRHESCIFSMQISLFLKYWPIPLKDDQRSLTPMAELFYIHFHVISHLAIIMCLFLNKIYLESNRMLLRFIVTQLRWVWVVSCLCLTLPGFCCLKADVSWRKTLRESLSWGPGPDRLSWRESMISQLQGNVDSHL